MEDQTIVEQRPVFENNEKKESKEIKDNNNESGDDMGKGKNNRTILIAVIAAFVLCCCCLLAGIAGYYAFITIRSVESSPIPQSDQIVPQSDFGNDNPPSGGLGNDILKNDTWNVMAPAAVGLGCDRPIGANSTIEVIQQPDANGVWIEHWTVACESGDTYLFEVEYILDDSGATFNIRPLQ